MRKQNTFVNRTLNVKPKFILYFQLAGREPKASLLCSNLGRETDLVTRIPVDVTSLHATAAFALYHPCQPSCGSEINFQAHALPRPS